MRYFLLSMQSLLQEYIYEHHLQCVQMAYELHGLLAGNVSIVTGENIRPSYGGDEEAFLKKWLPLSIVSSARKQVKANMGKQHTQHGVIMLI